MRPYGILEHAHITLEVYTEEARVALHVHPFTDRFLFVADGHITIVSKKMCPTLTSGDAMIIQAGTTHGFLMHTGGVRLLSVYMGSVHDGQTSQLPEAMRKHFFAMRDNKAALQSTSTNRPWSDLYSVYERSTTEWVQQELLKAIVEQRAPRVSLEPIHTATPSLPMHGWRIPPHTFILKVRNRSVSIVYNREHGQEYLSAREIFAFTRGLNSADALIPILA